MTIQIVTVHRNDADAFLRTADSLRYLSRISDKWNWLIKDGLSKPDCLQRLTEACQGFSPERVRLVSKGDSGIYDGMNQALELIDDDDSFCLFLNAGDLLSPEIVNGWQDLLDLAEDSDIMYGSHNRTSSGKVYLQEGPGEIDMAYLLGRTINHQSVFIRLKWLKKYRFDTNYTVVADWVQLFNLLRNENLRVRYLGIPICDYAGGGFSEIHDALRLEERQRFLQSLYSPWELRSLQHLTRMRSRAWYPMIQRALDSPGRSHLLSLLSRWI